MAASTNSPAQDPIEQITLSLIDGSEEDRMASLLEVKSSSELDRDALAERLRDEVQERFSPQHEELFKSAPRDPKQIPSIRSWMLSVLIWCDAESEESSKLLLSHLQPEFETERHVRFWVLAGLYQRQVKYLEQAITTAKSDESVEVQSLARAIEAPSDSVLLGDFKGSLSAADFKTNWPVLRVLRIVPIPELARDVCAAFTRSEYNSLLAYDALYALSSTEMAEAAVPILSKDPGVTETVRRVVSKVREANNNAVKQFASFLEAFNMSKVMIVIRELTEDSELGSSAHRLRGYLAPNGDEGADSRSETRWIEIEASPRLSIPDNSPEGLDVTLGVEDAGEVSVLEVIVHIAHGSASDLTIQLIHPDGTPAILHDQAGGFEQVDLNLILTSEETPALQVFHNRPAQGSWVLRVFDHANRKTLASLESWKLRLRVASAPGFPGQLTGLLHGSDSPRPSEFMAETFDGEDLLDIRSHVNAFASLMASTQLKPPLSIGLFGDWGSGKTFFMKQMKKRVEWLAGEAKKAPVNPKKSSGRPPFYHRIVQIEFNAWHYVESNLWASLVEHIFRNLRFRGDEGEKEVQRRRDFLLEKIDSSTKKKADKEREVRDARKDRDLAERALEMERQKMDRLADQFEREQRKEVWRELDLTKVRETLNPVFKKLGIDRTVKARSELRSTLDELGGLSRRSKVIWTWIVQGKGKGVRLMLLLAAVVGVPLLGLLIPYGIEWLPWDGPEFKSLSSAILQIGAFVGAVAAWVTKQVHAANEVFADIDAARNEYDSKLEALETTRNAEVERLENQLANSHVSLNEKRTAVIDCEEKLQDVREELVTLTAGARLARFIDERVASDDYRDQLGVLAMVRQDFETLSHLMNLEDDPVAVQQAIAPLDKDDPNRIDRIILYVDDLDRCPPDKVVQVLQAVHLLLAFPLFVVVVGVDARWVSRSLVQRYRSLWEPPTRTHPDPGASEMDEDWERLVPGQAAKPSDYLEKIFQIPFWLRPMGDGATRNYLSGLVNDVKTTEALHNVSETADSTQVPSGGEEAGSPPPDRPEREKQRKAESSTSDSTSGIKSLEANLPPKDLENAVERGQEKKNLRTRRKASQEDEQRRGREDMESLNPVSFLIRDIELDYMKGLSGVINRSPRAVKRFVNVYRLIRAGIPADKIETFVGTRREPGPFRIAMLLLAAVIGLPAATQVIFHHLANANPEDILSSYLATGAIPAAPDGVEAAIWTSIIDALREIAEGPHGNVGMEEVQSLVKEVSRYSFGAARI